MYAPAHRGAGVVFLRPLCFVPREHHFWCLARAATAAAAAAAAAAASLLGRVAILGNTPRRYGWQTKNETPTHALVSLFGS